MKQIVPFFSALALVAACNSNPKPASEIVKTAPVTIAADTAGLAQFQAWKAQHELANADQYLAQPAAEPAQKAVRTAAPARRAVSNRSATAQTGSLSSESANGAKAVQKRGWSKAAKGTAIGAGTGAVIGAVVNKKNRVVGGVIGGAAGGAVGYGIGRQMDKRDGRY